MDDCRTVPLNFFREMTFTVGLQGISAKDAEHVEDVVMNALRVCVRDGIKAADIYAITQRIELQTRTVRIL